MPESLTGRIKQEFDWKYCWPVADCPNCGRQDMPFGFSIETPPKTYCLNCHQFSKAIPKGYVSLIDLEETEWDSEL